MDEPELVVALVLDDSRARMWRELQRELDMDGPALGQHAITSLWISVQLQRAAARLK